MRVTLTPRSACGLPSTLCAPIRAFKTLCTALAHPGAICVSHAVTNTFSFERFDINLTVTGVWSWTLGWSQLFQLSRVWGDLTTCIFSFCPESKSRREMDPGVRSDRSG